MIGGEYVRCTIITAALGSAGRLGSLAVSGNRWPGKVETG